MYTKFEDAINDIFMDYMESINDLDNLDINNLLKSYFSDENYYITEIAELLSNNFIIDEFQKKYEIDIYDNKSYKKLFPRQDKISREKLISILFIDYIIETPGEYYNKFRKSFCKIFESKVNDALDYANFHYNNYLEEEYMIDRSYINEIISR